MELSIYLDWNATAPLHPAARSAWLAASDTAWGNPSSPHRFGQEARHAADQAKASCARSLGCKSQELIVVSGGSEGCAAAIHAALAARPGRRRIVASQVEHSAVLRNAALRGDLALAPVDGSGRVDPASVAALTDPSTALVAVQLANNEIGTIQPVSEVIAAVRAASDALILVDACQGVGRMAVDLEALGADFAVVAGHKLGAPKGVGLLYARRGLMVEPLIAGGRQQQDRRSGTEDAPALAALAAALHEAVTRREAESLRQGALIDACWLALTARLPQVRRLAAEVPHLSNTLALVHPGVDHRTLVARLDLDGIAVSTGSACMAARGEPSHVVRALGLGDDLARSLIRVSIGHTTTAGELDAFVSAYLRAVCC